MKECTNCHKICNDDEKMCGYCGKVFGWSDGGGVTERQIVNHQQEIENSSPQVAQSSNMQPQQSNVKEGNIKIEFNRVVKNTQSLIAAIACIVACICTNYVKSESYGSSYIGYSLREMSDIFDLKDVDGAFNRICCWFIARTFVFVIALIIMLIVGTFIDVSGFRAVIVILNSVSWVALGFVALTSPHTSYCFPAYILLAGIIMAAGSGGCTYKTEDIRMLE